MVDVDTGGMIGIGESSRDLINKSQEVARAHPEQTGQVLNKVEHIVDEQTGGSTPRKLDTRAEQLNGTLASKLLRGNDS